VASLHKVGGCTHAKIRTLAQFQPVYIIMICTKLSANVERLVGFIQTATAQSRHVAMVIDMWRVLAKIDTPRLHSLP